MSITHTTIADIYDSLVIPEYRLSVKGVLFYFLYFRGMRFWDNFICPKIIDNTHSSFTLGSCDLLFNSVSVLPHSMGIQRELADYCSGLGITTGVIDAKYINSHIRGFDKEFKWYPLYPIDRDIKSEIIEQSTYAFSLLKEYPLNKWQSEKGLDYLMKAAEMIEAYANNMNIMLDKIKPRAVILAGAREYSEIAAQIALKDDDIPLIIIPHGFSGKPSVLMDAAAVMSYSPYHDNYLKTLCTNSTKVEPLGWLEPSVTLKSNIDHIANRSPDLNSKYQVLFLSGYKGAKPVRCPALYNRIPEIINALNSMPEVGKIILRLHPGENIESIEVKNLLKVFNNTKLSISVGEPMAKNLRETNMLISLNSTGLLYAPYLNRPAVEIRDDSINSIWNCSILPKKNTYKIIDPLDANELKDFVRDAKAIKGSEFLYNWRREKKGFFEILSSLLK